MNRDYCQQRLANWIRLKGYSINTLSVYSSYLDMIFDEFENPQSATLLQLQSFAISKTNDNTRKNLCVLIRWLFDSVYHTPIDWRDLPYPKRKKKIQPIYTHEEAMAILRSVENKKQKAILALIIEQGLRVSEPCGILVSDCNSKERSIIIRSAKGGNDRTVYPSLVVWNMIKEYWLLWRKQIKDVYLFDGQRKGSPYTVASIRGFIQAACNRCGVEYKAVHSFRRYSITWGAEQGVSLGALADRSGHTTTRTIERHYLNHSKQYLRELPSPLNNISCQQSTF